MSIAYQTVQWNRHKRIYDAAIWASVVLYIVAFIVITTLTHPSPNDLGPEPILLMRATATCAFIMLHVILMIGPLARLSTKFAPLLYNRRHLGVSRAPAHDRFTRAVLMELARCARSRSRPATTSCK